MRNRAPVITFKRKAFEYWMDIFAKNDWRNQFSKSDFNKGTEFFDDCFIKEVEIREDDIVVRFLDDKKSQFFVVIDQESKPFVTRSSIDGEDGPLSSIAALLILDEIFLEKQEVLFANEADEITINNAEKKQSPQIKKEDTKQSFLKLHFYMAGQNLCFRAYWKSSEKLVFPDNPSRNAHASSKSEIGSVIQLIHLSRKAGFILNKKSKEYRINNIVTAVDFCKHTLSKWEQYFDILSDKDILTLSQGIHELGAIFKSQPTTNDLENNPDNIHVALKLFDKEIALPESFSKKILRAKGTPLFLEGYGVVKLKKEDVEQIQDQNSTLQKFGNQVPKYMLYSIFNATSIPFQEDEALNHWKKSFSSAPLKPFILPKILRSYQRDGVLWINHLLSHGFHGLVADDMGLGKTLQVLTFISKMPPEQQSIVVCPASVVYVWESEAAKFFPKLKVKIFSAESNLEEPDVNIWVVSYTQLRRNKTRLTQKPFQLVILDEAQFIKNPNTKIFHACSLLQSQWRLALSGTPIENHLLDLWSIFRFLMPGLLGEKSTFLEFIKSDEITERIKKQISPFVLRRTKENVATELPQKIELNVPCEMTLVQQRFYKEVIQNTVRTYSDQNNKLDLKRHRFGILSALTRLRQIACDPSIISSNITAHTFHDSCKLALLHEMLHQEFYSTSRKKIVIFSQFVKFLDRIKSMIKSEFINIPIFEIIGSTKNRNTVVSNFQNIDDNAIILVSLKAGGVGITLTEAESVFLMDPWWNPSAEKQAMDRVHRIGQNKKVSVYRLVTQNSIESAIQRLQDRKNNLFNEIIDSLKVKQYRTDFFLRHINELLKQE